MSIYAKFMKETKKIRYTDVKTNQLEVNCTVIIQRTLPQKANDQGQITFYVTIENLNVWKALADLGANINPYHSQLSK